ncbi:MAG: DUF128 domain-containing protein [Planctomycetota bacterium]|nr:DUF128 domain-containing protein [Planctomycetota bacterium]MCX8040730.1 DUF128 domain-containing protein [Planctomycetota bacterium]MDW8372383.1 DUF128 domain-containing protein [Planctomycetota bacterium]
MRDQPWRELLAASELLEALAAQGLELSERTLRLHCAELGAAGLIERVGKRGYRLTPAGLEAARALAVQRRLGTVAARMESMVCQLTFDPRRRQGLASINACVVRRSLLPTLLADLEAVYESGLAVGDRVLIAEPGSEVLGRRVPETCVGIGTVCSLTIAATLLAGGVPTQLVGGALLGIVERRPAHLLELVRYDASSLSPNELFIRARLTSVIDAARCGEGRITASLRELPMSALPRLDEALAACREAGLHGVLAVGKPGQTLLNAPLGEGRVGLLLATGLNPLAGLWERHLVSASDPDTASPMVGPAEWQSLIPVRELRARLARFL